MRPNLKKLMRLPWRERLGNWVKDTICRIFGHREDVIHKMYCDLCPRCYMVVKDRDTRTQLYLVSKEDE